MVCSVLTPLLLIVSWALWPGLSSNSSLGCVCVYGVTTALRANPSQTWTGMSGSSGMLALASRSPVLCKHTSLATLPAALEGRERGPERLSNVQWSRSRQSRNLSTALGKHPLPPLCLKSCLLQSQDSQRSFLCLWMATLDHKALNSEVI